MAFNSPSQEALTGHLRNRCKAVENPNRLAVGTNTVFCFVKGLVATSAQPLPQVTSGYQALGTAITCFTTGV